MRRIASLAIAFLLVLSSSSFLTIKGQKPTLIIASPHNEFIRNEFTRAFKDYYTATYGVDVDVQWPDLGGTSAILSTIEARFQNTPVGIGIDLMFGGGVDPFIKLAGEGLLTPYRLIDEQLALIPNNITGIPMYDPEYRWYGAALSGFGIVYNKFVLQAEGLPVPSTWADLTYPIDKGWVGSADPGESGSTHMCYEVILQGYGWQRGWNVATLMGANIKSFPASSSTIPRTVGAGDLAYGLAIDFYAWSEVAARGADKIGYVMPEGLTVVNPDSIAILKGAPSLELAERFESFVLSKQGQKLWMLPKGDPEGPKDNLLGRMSVIPELYDELQGRTVVPFNPFKMTTSLLYNATKGSIRYTILNDMIRALIIDSHEDLVAAWTSIISTNDTLNQAGITSPRIAEAIDALSEVPITEAEMEALAANWSDPQFRNQYIQQWHTFAKQKYANAVGLARTAGLDLVSAFQTQIADLKTTAQNNMYMGIGGGLVIGLVIGLAISLALSRRREIAAVKK